MPFTQFFLQSPNRPPSISFSHDYESARDMIAPWLIRLLVPVIAWTAPALAPADLLDDLERLDAIADAEYRNIRDVDGLEVPPFLHQKRLQIEAANLSDPWIGNRQCHAHFPRFPSLQITFKPDAVRSLRITHRENVEAAWIEGATVQMKQTRPESVLCFES